jgi:hypothetical protein
LEGSERAREAETGWCQGRRHSDTLIVAFLVSHGLMVRSLYMCLAAVFPVRFSSSQLNILCICVRSAVLQMQLFVLLILSASVIPTVRVYYYC